MRKYIIAEADSELVMAINQHNIEINKQRSVIRTLFEEFKLKAENYAWNEDRLFIVPKYDDMIILESQVIKTQYYCGRLMKKNSPIHKRWVELKKETGAKKSEIDINDFIDAPFGCGYNTTKFDGKLLIESFSDRTGDYEVNKSYQVLADVEYYKLMAEILENKEV